MHFKFRNVNDAFLGMVAGVHDGEILTIAQPSRYGHVLRIPEPVCVTYEKPVERVLFNLGRDANPFFHLFEALWMLAGRDDIAPIGYYVPKMHEFSDDGGKTQPAAYGKRWRSYFGWDQLDAIVKELSDNPQSRRVVLSMWNPMSNADITEAMPDDDFYKACNGSKDVPCNTHAYFDVFDNKLHMTVCNRSNDMVWGMFGANVVHFSVLQEYLACCIGVGVGKYHQITNNLHVYTERWEPEKYLAYANQAQKARTMHSPPQDKRGIYADSVEDCTVNGGVLPYRLLLDKERFDHEVKLFIDDPYQEWKEPFFNLVAKPMCLAFRHHKARQYDLAMEAVSRVKGSDWQLAATNWLAVRRKNWEEKEANGNAYHERAVVQAKASSNQD